MRKAGLKIGIAVLALVSVVNAKTTQPEEIVAYFGDTPVYAEEMIFHLRDHVALVAVHFKTKHNRDLSGKGWLNETDGEIPVNLLQQKAMASCQEAIAIQLLARENEIGKPLSFPEFSKACLQVNEIRRKDHASGKPIYGLMEYTPAQLYQYKIGNMRIHLMDALSAGTFEQKERALKEAVQKRISSWSIRLVDEKLKSLTVEQVGAQ